MKEAYLASRKRRLIGLISAVSSEGEFLVREMKNVRKRVHGHLLFYKGKVLGKDVVYAVSGIGKTNAAHATALLVQNYSPSVIIDFGVGGAYPGKGLKVGDIAVATKEIYADEGVLLKDGFHPLNLIGIPLLRKPRKRYFNEFPVDRRLAGAVLRSAGHIAHTRPGIFNTVSLCTGTSGRARELGERFNAICESMEGAAIIHLCNLYGIPCCEVRGISNIVEDRDIAKWDIRLAAENCQKTVIDFLGSLG
jgi:futalosine hydrolase